MATRTTTTVRTPPIGQPTDSRQLGKRPHVYDSRTLQLAKYIDSATLAPPPTSKQFYSKVTKNWGMMANNTIGDCTCAAAGHMILEWSTYDDAKPIDPTDQQIIKAYSEISGYNPTTHAHDNGAAELDVLRFWRKDGIAGYKIAAFVALEPKNHDQVMDAVALFGNCYIGLQLPVSAQNQKVWSVPAGGPVGNGAPGSWGGHAVPIVGYTPRDLTVVTWGALLTMTWQFFDAYCDEAYAVLSEIWAPANKKGPAGFDLKQLRSDLQEIAR
jgi:hypothetical protein